MLISASGTLEKIVEEVERMNEEERQLLLIKLRARKMRGRYKPAAAYREGLKVPTLKEIDRIKHASRKK